MTMPQGVIVTDDLLFASRVIATGRAAGLTVVQVKDGDRLKYLIHQNDSPCGVILDLQSLQACLQTVISETLQTSPRPRVIAYGSHVEIETLRAAREAGCDLVLPRSAFAERLEAELPQWLTRPS